MKARDRPVALALASWVDKICGAAFFGPTAPDDSQMTFTITITAGEWRRMRTLVDESRYPVARGDLSSAQHRCLLHFVCIDERGANDGFKFGAATLASLSALGLIESFRGYPWPGAKEHAMWRATQAGRAMFPDVATRPARPL